MNSRAAEIDTVFLPESKRRTVNGNDRAIAAFTGLSHGTLHGYELSIPIFVPIWLATFDVSPTLLGLVVGIGFGMVGFGAPVAGVLADRYGSRRLVLGSIAGMGIGFAALGAVDSIVTLAIALVVWGGAASLYHPAGLSLISRGADRRGTVLATHGAGGNVGMVVVPLAAIVLLAVVDWRIAAIVLSVPAACALAIGVALSFDEGGERADAGDDTGPNAGSGAGSNAGSGAGSNAGSGAGSNAGSGGRAGTTGIDPSSASGVDPNSTSGVVAAAGRFLRDARALLVGGFVLVLTVQLLYGASYRGVITFLPDVLADLALFEPIALGENEIGAGQLAYTALLVLGVFGQYAGGVASDRIRPERALLATLVALFVATALFVPATGAGSSAVLVVCGLIGFFLFAFAPIGQSLVAEYVDADSHGLSFGLVYFGTFGIGAAGSALAGWVLDLGGVPALFTALATLVGLAILVAGVLYRYSRRAERRSPAETPAP